MSLASQRSAASSKLLEAPLDVLVVGGGIVGSGIARDAALRGLKVGLIEQHDFAFGTSSRSSRLLHGGLRYLAQGRLGLVREASVEKGVIHRIAPHLSQPMPFLFPAYRFNHDWVLWQLKVGVKLYDLLCGRRNFGRSTWLSPSQVGDIVPDIDGAHLEGGVRYFDGFTNDARLTLDTLRSAERAGAVILNYCRLTTATWDRLWNCVVEDRHAGVDLQVQACTVVNATGAWADALPHSRVKLRLTKGVHLVVDHRRLPVPETVVMTQGKRILFAIPWGERTILGTTDTDYRGSLEDVRVDGTDVRYVLRVCNRFFPRANLVPEDVLSAWAGLRPLLADPNGRPSDISRSHEIQSPAPGWWDVAGGKLTTYRLMAQQTVDRIVRWLAKSDPGRHPTAPCHTAVEPLLPRDAVGWSGILPPEFCRRAVEHYCREEWALHVDDVMMRRTSWHHYHSDATTKAVQVVEWMGELLGWSRTQHVAELDRYHAAADCLPGRKATTSTEWQSRNDQAILPVV